MRIAVIAKIAITKNHSAKMDLESLIAPIELPERTAGMKRSLLEAVNSISIRLGVTSLLRIVRSLSQKVIQMFRRVLSLCNLQL